MGIHAITGETEVFLAGDGPFVSILPWMLLVVVRATRLTEQI